MTEIAPRMARAGFEAVTVPKGTRRSDMGLPKPCIPRAIIPPLAHHELSWLAGELGPPERLALRHIVETADLLDVGDSGTWLLVPTTTALLDALAAFEVEGEDRENDIEDEPQSDDEPSIGGSTTEDRELDECDHEPDGAEIRRRFVAQVERLSGERGWDAVTRIKRMVRGTPPMKLSLR